MSFQQALLVLVLMIAALWLGSILQPHHRGPVPPTTTTTTRPFTLEDL